VEESVWKKGVREDAHTKGLGLCYRTEGRIHAKKEEGIFTVEREKERGTSICRRSIKERIYLTLQITPNITSTLCGKKEWHTEDGTRLFVMRAPKRKQFPMHSNTSSKISSWTKGLRNK